ENNSATSVPHLQSLSLRAGRGRINGAAHRLDWRPVSSACHIFRRAPMRLPSAARAVLFVLALFAGSSAARADDGAVTLVIFKAGWFVGGSAGQGVLTFHDQTYALTAGGNDGGPVFGGPATTLT